MVRGVSDSTASIGFYHSKWSLLSNPAQDQATPMDYLGINIEGPSSEGFFFYPVYRVHGNGAKTQLASSGPKLRIYPDRSSHTWSLRYDPEAANGSGRITVSLDSQTCTLDLDSGDRRTGAFFDRFEAKLAEHPSLKRAAVELAKDWRTDRSLSRLEAMLAVANKDASLIITGNGDVIEPDEAVAAIGSGGPYAKAAAVALMENTALDAREIVEKAMAIAGKSCIYTNENVSYEELG